MNERIARLLGQFLAAIVICAFAAGIAWGVLYGLDQQALADEAAYSAERTLQVRVCNAMVGAHRMECLNEIGERLFRSGTEVPAKAYG